MTTKPVLQAVEPLDQNDPAVPSAPSPDPFNPENDAPEEQLSIRKPSGFSLDKFKSKRAAALAGVETLQTALPHHSISQAKDFVRLHPNEETHWTPELCFVSVPIKGEVRDTLHLIEEDLAMKFLPSASIRRFRLALAINPDGAVFLCHVPTQNLDNSWNVTNLQACEKSKTHWVKATSRKAERVEGYKVDNAQDPDAFDEPEWPTQPLAELVNVTFAGKMIETEDDPALRRLIGAKQSTS